MDKGEKRSFDQMEGLPSEVYVLSPSECRRLDNATYEEPRFRKYGGNSDLDIDNNSKMAALKAAPSVVSLVSFSGKKLLFQTSGTIIEVDDNINTVMTSLNLIRPPLKSKRLEDTLAQNLKIIVHSSDEKSYIGQIETYDFHYNLLMIKFKSTVPLESAKIGMIDDDLSLDRTFQLRPHGSKAKPGDRVLVVGRYFYRSFEFMAAPGYFRMDRSDPVDYGCRELLSTSCNISRCGDGGSVINLSGEVVGIAYYQLVGNSLLLPINVAFKWWSHFKTQKELRHPSYGIEASNLYCAVLRTLESVLKKIPKSSNGVLVEKIQPGSYAESAGLHEGDIIIKCDGKNVKSFFELWDVIWDKVGQVVEFEVLRVDHSNFLSISISMPVGEATPDEVNSWPPI